MMESYSHTKLTDFFTTLSDEDLWNQFKKGNENAFIFIYQQYFDDLYLYGRKICHDRPTIEDAIQDMFIEMRAKKNQIKIRSSIKYYLLKSFRRRLLLYINTTNRQTIIERSSSNTFDVTISRESQMINEQIERENKLKLEQLINRLKPKQKEVIYFFYYENFSYEQIKDIMGFKNIKSIRNLLYKALDKMKLDT